ncbi:MAG: hypothetical protein ACK4Z6_01230 [Candidatus Methylomirabilales bacterium]
MLYMVPMVPGFNTAVIHRGKSYHVQTEDLGKENPYLLTLLYQGGAIIYRMKTNYLEVLGPDPNERQIRKLMEQQHQQVIADLKAGRFDKDQGRKGEKSLEQLILEYLSAQEGQKGNEGKG